MSNKWGNAKPGQILGYDRDGNEIGIDPPGSFKMGEVFKGKVVAITDFQGRLFVALEDGVFVRGDDDVFRPMIFEDRMTATEVTVRNALRPNV